MRAWLLAAGLAATAAASAAEPPPATSTSGELAQDTSPAIAHYREGVRLYDAGALAAALEAFEQAYRASGNYQVLFNIAQLHYRLGQLSRARQALERYAELGGSRLNASRRELIARQLQELEQRTARAPLARDRSQNELPPSAPASRVVALPPPAPPARGAAMVAWSTAGALGLGAAGSGLATLLTSRHYDRLRAHPTTGSGTSARARLDTQRGLVRHLALATDLLALASVASAATGLYFELGSSGSTQAPLALQIGPGELRARGSF